MLFDRRESAQPYTPGPGESLASIAEAHGLQWQDLARFNWGTDDPAEVEAFLRDELGCCERGADNGFVFGANDRPRGELLIPQPLRMEGLAPNQRHRVTVRRIATPKQFLGCCSLPSATFALESSFIRPSVVEHLKLLAMLANANPEAKVQVFGHTDASGSEDFNKKLSERRAWSAYAFIVNDPEAWETLYNHPDESWGVPVLQEILAELGHFAGAPTGNLDDATKDAMRSFRGLPPDAPVSNDAGFRSELFAAYMSSVHDVDLPAERFLDPGFMGCGEYNPLEEGDGPEAREANRRVTFFLFHPERPPNLPCAFADTKPCKAQQVSLDRRHQAHRTCSFYDSLLIEAPHEAVDTLRIRLFDPFGKAIAGAACTVAIGGTESQLTSDDEGFVELPIVGGHERAVVEWDDPAVEEEELDDELFGDGEDVELEAEHHRLELYLHYDQGAPREELALRRLANLGYTVDPAKPATDQRGALLSFQLHYRDRVGDEAELGTLDEPTLAAIEEVHDSLDPVVTSSEEGGDQANG